MNKAKNDRTDRAARAQVRALYRCVRAVNRAMNRMAKVKDGAVAAMKARKEIFIRVNGRLVNALFVRQAACEVAAHRRAVTERVKFRPVR